MSEEPYPPDADDMALFVCLYDNHGRRVAMTEYVPGQATNLTPARSCIVTSYTIEQMEDYVPSKELVTGTVYPAKTLRNGDTLTVTVQVTA